jgi:hypothetical protein
MAGKNGRPAPGRRHGCEGRFPAAAAACPACGSLAPVVPKSGVASQALILVIAIMSFLACVTVGAVSLVNKSAATWQSQIAREATIQIRPADNMDMDDRAGGCARTIAASFDGVREARIISRAETVALLEPWLGSGLGSGRAAGAAACRGDHRRGVAARFRAAAQRDQGSHSRGFARRPPRLGGPAGRHGAHDDGDRASACWRLSSRLWC